MTEPRIQWRVRWSLERWNTEERDAGDTDDCENGTELVEPNELSSWLEDYGSDPHPSDATRWWYTSEEQTEPSSSVLECRSVHVEYRLKHNHPWIQVHPHSPIGQLLSGIVWGWCRR